MDEEIKNVQNEDGINEETAEETTANAEAEEETNRKYKNFS